MAGANRQASTQRTRGCCFGPSQSGALLTFVAGRWRLWHESVDDKASEVSHSDAAESYTAASWGPESDDDGRSSGKGLAAASLRFALGCASGRVQVWDARSGELAGPTAQAFAAVVKGADARVVAVALASRRRGSVFAACGNLPEVLEIGVADGATRCSFKVGKVGLAQLATCGGAGEWLLTACPSSALKLWRLQDAPKGAKAAAPPPPAQQLRLAGPANKTSALDMCSVAGELLALCADGTMQVDVFNCSSGITAGAAAGDNKQPPLSAAFVLSGHEQIRSARFAPVQPGTEGRVTVIGFGSSMVACWHLRLDKAGKNGAPRTVAAAFVALSSELGGRVLCASPTIALQEGRAPVLAAFGPAANPAFAKLRAPATKGGAAVIELSESSAKPIPEAAKGTAEPSADAATAVPKKKPQQPIVLGPLEAAVERRQPKKRPHAEMADLAGAAPEAEGGAGMGRKRQQLPEGGKAQGGLSVVPMVRQGLRAKDKASIEKILQISDLKIIDNTIAELTGSEAFDLMQECTHRILSQPARTAVFCRWIQRTIMRHSAFLFSQPALHQALQPLRDVFLARCASNKNLVKLHGRLLMLRNCGRVLDEQNKETKTSDDVAKAPLLEYTEGDEDLAEEASQDEDSVGGGDDGGSGDEDLDDSDDDILIDGFD